MGAIRNDPGGIPGGTRPLNFTPGPVWAGASPCGAGGNRMDVVLLLFGVVGTAALGLLLLVLLVIAAQRGVVEVRLRALPRGSARERVSDLALKRAHAEAQAADLQARAARAEGRA